MNRPAIAKRTRLVGMAACALLLLTLAFPVRAQQTERAKALGKRMLCVCGCGQILTECNHVGCTYSGQMLKELDERVARNEPDDLTLQAFVQEYGIGVMAQPASHGFGLTAWVMPFAVLLIGAWLAWAVIKRWRHRAVVAPAAKVSPELLARARREMENEE